MKNLFSLEDLVHDDLGQVVVDDDVAHHLLLADLIQESRHLDMSRIADPTLDTLSTAIYMSIFIDLIFIFWVALGLAIPSYVHWIALELAIPYASVLDCLKVGYSNQLYL